MTHQISFAIQGTLDRLISGVALIPVFLAFVVVAVAVLWYFGERRFR